jgi:hypothetical protein
MMSMKFAALAVAGLALTPLTAFAQSAPAPINQTGPGVSAPVSSSTDMGIAGQSGNTWAAPGGVYSYAPSYSYAPGGGAYASVPGGAYVGEHSYAAVPAPRTYRGHGAYAAYGAPDVGYGYAYGAPGMSYGYADEY